MLDFTDGSVNGQRFVIEDDGFPNVVLNALKAYLDNQIGGSTGKALLGRSSTTSEKTTPQRPDGLARRRDGRG